MTAESFESESTAYVYGEYEIQLLESLNTELMCPVCLSIYQKPTLTDCCGSVFCAQCIHLTVDKYNKACPTCGESQFNTLLDRRTERQVQGLLTTCVNKNKGCNWTGNLGYLEKHLKDSDEGGCEYVLVECPLNCGKSYKKKELESHTKNDCLQRDSSCPYCPFRGTYQFFTDKHIPVCQYYPVKCPNDCGVTCEREDVEYHLKNICDKENISCSFSVFGCDAHLKRQKVTEHMENSVQRHLSLLADTTLKLMEGGQLKLNAIQETDVESHPMKDQVGTAVQELQAEDGHRVKGKVEGNKLDLYSSSIYPVKHHIVLPSFKQKMRKRDCINMDPIYSHDKGYKFMLQVWPYGDGKTYGTHASADIYPVPGEYDHQLLWPVNLTFTFLVIDQKIDQNHLKREITVVWNKEDVGMFFSEHSFELFAHSRLEDNKSERTQFIKDGTVLLQYTQVQVHS